MYGLCTAGRGATANRRKSTSRDIDVAVDTNTAAVTVLPRSRERVSPHPKLPVPCGGLGAVRQASPHGCCRSQTAPLAPRHGDNTGTRSLDPDAVLAALGCDPCTLTAMPRGQQHTLASHSSRTLDPFPTRQHSKSRALTPWPTSRIPSDTFRCLGQGARPHLGMFL